MSEVKQAKTRESVKASIATLCPPEIEQTDFWTSFFETSTQTRGRTLVVADLASIVRKYRSHDHHAWVTSVRRTLPYFLALVRTKRDSRHTDIVDDIVKHSDFRISVCKMSNTKDMEACLVSALNALNPNALTEVRYSPSADRLWVTFGDGSSGFVGWQDLSIDDLRDTLVPESATVGSQGSAVEIVTNDGDLFDIDAASIKAVIDSSYASILAETARKSDVRVGQRVRTARQKLGMSQKELEARTNIDQAIISKLERGKHQPRVDTLRRIAEGLDLTLQELLVQQES